MKEKFLKHKINGMASCLPCRCGHEVGYKTSVVLSLSAQVLLGDNYLWLLQHGEVYNELNVSTPALDSESLGYSTSPKGFAIFGAFRPFLPLV